MRYYNFSLVELVHIDDGPAKIISISGPDLRYIDDSGEQLQVDLAECARIYGCLNKIKAFPPSDDVDWGALVEAVPGFSTLPLPAQAVVGLRGAIDEPPWFQFLNPRRTQFEFRDYDHIKAALLDPLSTSTRWYSWDAS